MLALAGKRWSFGGYADVHSAPRPAIHGRRRRACVVVAAGLVGLCSSVAGLTGGVDAAFPGANGWIAFEAATSNNLQDKEIWVTHQSPAGWTRHRLTTDPPDRRAADQFPSVNPKGREVAYASNRNWPEFPNVELDSEIYVMDIHDDDGDGYGDHLRRLTDNAVADLDPNWSPDGKRIVWNSNAADPTKNVPLDLYVMAADGEGPPIKLPRDPAATTTQHAEVSPDGQWVVFVSGYGAMRPIDFDLFMTRSDGNGPVIRLTNTPTIGETHPDFAPDGTRLVFAATEDLDGDGVADTDLDLYVMAAAPRSDTNLPVAITNGMTDTLTGTETNERWPSWSPDCTRIVTWVGLGNALSPAQRPALWLVDPFGGAAPVRISDPTVTPAAYRPDWGPEPRRGNQDPPPASCPPVPT